MLEKLSFDMHLPFIFVVLHFVAPEVSPQFTNATALTSKTIYVEWQVIQCWSDIPQIIIFTDVVCLLCMQINVGNS